MYINVKNNIEIEKLKRIMIENNLFDKYNLSQIGVFGSAARGEQANDLDILINGEVDYRQLIDFRDELEKLLNKKVDVVIEKYANPIVLYRARKEIRHINFDELEK
ncbi:MAG: uncharacterized protein PWQ96_1149 [Clostridia bacterium]|jgi:hypothetical protein|nr:putative nucleotidyltransferase [Clostridiales bacterium]MDK2985507.1 uncharacterized protein [Clostridia bacterium]